MRKYGAQQLTQAQVLASMKTHMAQCSDERLEKLTVLDLQRIYRLPAKEIEYHLLVTQQRRREFVRTGAVA